jgi:hypothetical protein
MGIGEDYNTKLKAEKKKQISFAMQQAIDKSKIISGDYKGTSEEDATIARFVEGVTRKWGANPPGHGDKFKEWCVKHGRQLPSDESVELMNADPFSARKMIRNDYKNPAIYRSLVTYISMGGLKNV